jgi:hypothetical protein
VAVVQWAGENGSPGDPQPPDHPTEETAMNATNQTARTDRHAASGLALKSLCLTIALLSGGVATADAGQSKLVGVWKNEVQFVDCTSGQVIAPPGFALHTYYADGNHLVISAGNPAMASPGQGRWSKAGKNTFAAYTRGFLFDANGFYAGYTILERMITLAKDGQTLEYTARGSFYTVDDQFLLTSCAVGTGVKLPGPTPF